MDHVFPLYEIPHLPSHTERYYNVFLKLKKYINLYKFIIIIKNIMSSFQTLNLNIIIFLSLISISKTFMATLLLHADDYIDDIIIDGKSLDNGINFIDNYYHDINRTFELFYDSILKIQISNKEREYGIAATLSFNNGEKEEIYKTDEYWLWKTNDTRYQNNFPYINNYENNGKALIIGYNDDIHSDYPDEDHRYSSYLYTFVVTGIVRCENFRALKIKVGDTYDINLPDSIKTKAQHKNEVLFKILNEFKGKIYDENNNEIKMGIEYNVINLKYTTEKYNTLDTIKYSLTYDFTTVKCEIQMMMMMMMMMMTMTMMMKLKNILMKL